MGEPFLETIGFARRWLSKASVLTIMAMPLILAYLAFAFAPLSITCSGPPVGCVTPPVHLFAGIRALTVPVEYQMILFIGLIGGLGGYGAALKDSRRLARNGPAAWLRGNLNLVLLGAAMAIAFYIVIRAGTFSPAADLGAVNVLGIAVLAMVTGYSAPAAVAHLAAVSDRLFEDSDSARMLTAAISRLDSRLETTFSKPVLDNWSGQVAVIALASRERPIIPGKARTSTVRQHEPIRCLVHFLPRGGEPSEPFQHAFIDRIEIKSGNPDPPSVRFDVTVDGADFDFEIERATWRSGAQGERALQFDGFVPATAGDHRLYVTVSQKGRLIQSIWIPVKVSSAKRGRPKAGISRP